MSGQSEHSGHRARLRETFLNHGLDALQDHHVLELLLCYAIPRRDVKPLARALLKHFGSISAVLEASAPDLLELKGIGENAMSLIRLITELGRRYQIDKAKMSLILSSTELIGQFVVPLFYGFTDEAVYMLCLDGKKKVTHYEKLAEGTVNSTNFSIRRLVETAIKRKAVHVILAHNHPSGLAIPNVTDIATTEQLIEALSTVNIYLEDHIIVAGDDFVSLRDSGHLDNIKKRLRIP